MSGERITPGFRKCLTLPELVGGLERFGLEASVVDWAELRLTSSKAGQLKLELRRKRKACRVMLGRDASCIFHITKRKWTFAPGSRVVEDWGSEEERINGVDETWWRSLREKIDEEGSQEEIKHHLLQLGFLAVLLVESLGSGVGLGYERTDRGGFALRVTGEGSEEALVVQVKPSGVKYFDFVSD